TVHGTEYAGGRSQAALLVEVYRVPPATGFGGDSEAFNQAALPVEAYRVLRTVYRVPCTASDPLLGNGFAGSSLPRRLPYRLQPEARAREKPNPRSRFGLQ